MLTEHNQKSKYNCVQAKYVNFLLYFSDFGAISEYNSKHINIDKRLEIM